MVRLTASAAISLLLPTLALSRPNAHDHLHQRRNNTGDAADYSAIRPTGIHGAPPNFGHTGTGVPFPTGNATFPAPTGTAASTGLPTSNLITLKSTITIVPVPVSASVCGPATVTVTARNTVTVTVGGSASASFTSKPTTSHEIKDAIQPPHSTALAKPDIKNAIHPAHSAAPVALAKSVEQKPKMDFHLAQNTAAAVSTPSSTPDKKSSVAGKGLIYQDISVAKSASGLGWASDWDSSPIPAVGHAQGSLNGVQYVPQLICTEEVHTSIWAANSAGHPYVMSINEPDQASSVGGCGPMDVGSAVDFHKTHFQANKAAGQKIVSPCVSNPGDKWLDSFFSSIGSDMKPDAMCFHWYGESLEGLKSVVSTFQALQQKHNVPELWMSEFAFNVDVENAAEVVSYLEGCGLDRWAYNALKLVTTPKLKDAYM